LIISDAILMLLNTIFFFLKQCAVHAVRLIFLLQVNHTLHNYVFFPCAYNL